MMMACDLVRSDIFYKIVDEYIRSNLRIVLICIIESGNSKVDENNEWLFDKML